MIVDNSSRLKYRVMTAKDAELLYQLDQNPNVMKYINGGKITSQDDIQNISLPRMKSYTNVDSGWGLWKVSLAHSSEFIGWVLVRPMNFFSDEIEYDNLEIGWRFKQEAWGKGYATEAAETLKQALITLGAVKKLSAIAMENNQASINIMKKLGMKYLKKDIHKGPFGDQKIVFYQLELTHLNGQA